jgi:hypothetical protein
MRKDKHNKIQRKIKGWAIWTHHKLGVTPGAAKGKQILKTDIVIDLSIVSTYISIMPSEIEKCNNDEN